jgi:hypothetical protein
MGIYQDVYKIFIAILFSQEPGPACCGAVERPRGAEPPLQRPLFSECSRRTCFLKLCIISSFFIRRFSNPPATNYPSAWNSPVYEIVHSPTLYSLQNHFNIADIRILIALQQMPPIRPPQGSHNDDFSNTCFLDRAEDGPVLRMNLRNVLRSQWWIREESYPQGELDSFGVRHGPREFECRFCAKRFKALQSLVNCIKNHINYHPSN